MKLLRFALWLFVLPTWINAYGQTLCNHTIPASQTTVNGVDIAPGDTVCLLGGNKDFLFFSQLVGTAEKPIVVVNRNGNVIIHTTHFYGIKFSHCKHVKLLGINSDSYGIRILKVANGAGISVDELSTNIEIAYVEVSNTAFGGIYAKTEPDCSFESTRDKFLLSGLHIHHCYIHDVADEGMYIGSAKYTGQYLPACDTTVLPHLLTDVRVHDNIVERTGWDGIQVSSTTADCSIFNNIIRSDSYRETNGQMSGILIGGGSNCDCYNNQILDGKGDGIDIFGFGEMKIYNNLIVRAGKSFQPENNNVPKHGIFIGNAPDNAGARFKIMHNTIIKPKTTGLRFSNFFTSANLFFNNIIANPGASPNMGEAAYFDNSTAQNNFNLKQNLFSEQVEPLGFVDFANDNYDLRAGSVAVNKAFDAGLNNVPFDILNRPRPHNSASDIGAYECQAVNARVQAMGVNDRKMNVSFNAEQGKIVSTIFLSSNDIVDFQLFDANGKLLSSYTELVVGAGEHQFSFSVKSYPPGIYFLQCRSKNHQLSKKFLIQ